MKFNEYEKILEQHKNEPYFVEKIKLVDDINNYMNYKDILTDVEKQALIENLSYFWCKQEFYEYSLFDLLTICLDEGIYTAINYNDFKRELERKM